MSRVQTPFNLDVLYLEPAELRTLEKITIPDVFDGHSQIFHDQGLFSTRIFGNVGTEQRDNTFAFRVNVAKIKEDGNFFPNNNVSN